MLAKDRVSEGYPLIPRAWRASSSRKLRLGVSLRRASQRGFSIEAADRFRIDRPEPARGNAKDPRRVTKARRSRRTMRGERRARALVESNRQPKVPAAEISGPPASFVPAAPAIRSSSDPGAVPTASQPMHYPRAWLLFPQQCSSRCARVGTYTDLRENMYERGLTSRTILLRASFSLFLALSGSLGLSLACLSFTSSPPTRSLSLSREREAAARSLFRRETDLSLCLLRLSTVSSRRSLFLDDSPLV